MALIDTHELIEELVAAGEKKEVALIIAKTARQSNDNLVNKSDLKLSVSELRSEMSSMKSELRSEMSDMKHDLGTRIEKIDTNLNWLKAIGLLLVGLGIKAAFFN